MNVVRASLVAAGDDQQKAAPLGLFVLLLLGVACYFLFKSMSRHLKRVREDFPTGTNPPGSTPSRPRPTGPLAATPVVTTPGAAGPMATRPAATDSAPAAAGGLDGEDAAPGREATARVAKPDRRDQNAQ